MLDFRTDMADERLKEYEKIGKIEGISSENIDIDDKLRLTKVKVLNEKGKEQIGKDIGTYITAEIKEIEIITKKPITASLKEMTVNTRSKCAKLRIAEKIT